MTWLARVGRFGKDVYVLYLGVRDSRTAWYAKALGALVAVYAFSPVDLIPEPIPILGHLDDLVLIPLGVWATISLIPKQVLAEARGKAAAVRSRIAWWVGALIVIGIWLFVTWWLVSLLRG